MTNELAGLQKSLIKEFDFFDRQTIRNTVILEAKKKQLQRFDLINDISAHIFKENQRMADYITKLQGCLLHYGITPAETEIFINKPVEHLVSDVKENLKDGIIHVPENLQKFISGFEKDLDRAEKESQKIKENKPIKYAVKPVYDWETLKQLTSK